MDWLKHFSIAYFLKLIGLTLLLNYFSIGYNGLVSPEGPRYSALLDHYLNYIQWIRQTLMYGSSLLAKLLGTDTYISGPQIIKIGNNIDVEIWLPCLGIGIMSFWTAFIVTNTGRVRNKVAWWAGGLFSIYLINCCRIGLLLVALDTGWTQNSAFDHHDLFNITAYILIGLLMHSYTEDKPEMKTYKRIIQPLN